MIVWRRPLTRTALTVSLLAGAAAIAAVPPGGRANDPFGDVAGLTITPPSNPDGVVTLVDSAAVQAYLASPSSLTDAQKDRVRRYGDVAGTANRNTVGNNLLDTHDTQRHLLLSGGIIDSGTASVYRADYGDVSGDGAATIVDAVLVQRYLAGKVSDPAIISRIRTRGLGDISPTIPFITFGDGTITADDAAVVAARANGTEAYPPAYVDYWPLHSPDFENPTTLRDTYRFTDLNGVSGDQLNQIRFLTAGALEQGGYTVTPVLGDDNSEIGVYKGADGSVYMLFIAAPTAFGLHRIDFQSPIKLIDAKHTAVGSTWSGRTEGRSVDIGVRPAPYTVTVLETGDEWTPAAGAKTAPSDVPKSTWSKTLKLRLDIALLAGKEGDVEMQQAFFYDFAPFIGLVSRGQAARPGALAPEANKPLWQLDSATVRGIAYAP